MTQVLRKIANKRNWDGPHWLGEHDCQAQVVDCLGPQFNKLSVYVVRPDQLGRVVAALALTRDNLASLDLAIADASILSEQSIKEDTTLGATPDNDVNVWHRDLVELSIGRLAALATAIRTGGKIQRFQPREVLRAIATSIDSGHIDIAELRTGMAASLRKRDLIR